jgi:hypothetical protein
MKILGEAMCGHVVTTESCIHQIHRCRATLAVAQINNLFVQKFAGSLQSLIRNKSFSREETTQVRDFVNTRLRDIIVSGVFAMGVTLQNHCTAFLFLLLYYNQANLTKSSTHE